MRITYRKNVMTIKPPALLIIDMQKCMANTNAKQRNNHQAEANIALVLAKWRSAKWPIVHVRHLSRSPESGFWPGQIGAEFQDAFIPHATEHIVDKNVSDAFANSGLESWLHQRGITEIIIVGVSTNISVEASARSASCLGFKTSVVADATFTFDRVDLNGMHITAETIHIMSLTNLNGEYASIVDTASLIG
jgi:nicotinamidase-related amidase